MKKLVAIEHEAPTLKPLRVAVKSESESRTVSSSPVQRSEKTESEKTDSDQSLREESKQSVSRISAPASEKTSIVGVKLKTVNKGEIKQRY